MHDVWFTGPSAGHVKRVPVHGMQGPLEKKSLSLLAAVFPGSLLLLVTQEKRS
jgi:hypothetical protein